MFRKYSKIRNKLAKNLFILTPILGKALLSIQAMCCEMYMKTFADVSRDMDTAFFYFIEDQVKRISYGNFLFMYLVLGRPLGAATATTTAFHQSGCMHDCHIYGIKINILSVRRDLMKQKLGLMIKSRAYKNVN